MGIVLITVLFFLPSYATMLTFSALCAVGAWELTYNTKLVPYPRLVIYTCLVAFMVPLWSYFGMLVMWGDMLVIGFMILLFMELMLSKGKLRFEKICICFFSGMIMPYALAGIVRLRVMDYGKYIVAVPFIVAFVSDTGAYFAGHRFGRHKLAPSVSPNKTLEGALGGLASVYLGMAVFLLIVSYVADVQANFLSAFLIATLGFAADVFGDLCMSAIKRQTGIKDYGIIFPGHGGVMDRFDSLITVVLVVEIIHRIIPVVIGNG